MYKILISGYYGFNNIGDESILSAVVASLREQLTDIDITVLSQNPESTAARHGIKSVNRKSFRSIFGAIRKCDLLISGGGSLLQDVTSKKSILYYLLIMWIVLFFRKKVFIYSQGIGPILSKMNRRLTAMTLKKVHGIVVRDETSKELLIEIGVTADRVCVTADPVLRIKKAELSAGQKILKEEGFQKVEGKLSVGFAIREKKTDSNFVDEICISIARLVEEYNAQIVLIPFHFSEDMAVLEEIESRLKGKVSCVKHKYLTNEMLSIIGNMDVLVGVRLHALIHAAIMGVPMIAISYDPKINSFMHSMDMKAMCSMYDFKNDFFIEEFEKTVANAAIIKENVSRKIEALIKKLATNEEMIRSIMTKQRH